MDESYTAVGDIVVLSYHEPAGPLGFLPTHAYLIKGREPILIETGLYTQAEGFLEALRAEIDPAELRLEKLPDAEPFRFPDDAAFRVMLEQMKAEGGLAA